MRMISRIMSMCLARLPFVLEAFVVDMVKIGVFGIEFSVPCALGGHPGGGAVRRGLSNGRHQHAKRHREGDDNAQGCAVGAEWHAYVLFVQFLTRGWWSGIINPSSLISSLARGVGP